MSNLKDIIEANEKNNVLGDRKRCPTCGFFYTRVCPGCLEDKDNGNVPKTDNN